MTASKATVTFLLLGAISPEAVTEFDAANAAYESGDFPTALLGYERLVDEGFDSGWNYYNLGNSYLRNNQLGRAIAAYRRSEVRLPRNGDVRANLQFARQRAKDAIAATEPAALPRALFFWHYGLSYHELTFTTAICNGFFWLVLGLNLWYRQSQSLRWGCVILGIMVTVTGTSLFVRSTFSNHIIVVNKPEVEVHTGTQLDTVVRFKLHEGTEAQVVDTQNGWRRIELSDGKQGWVMADDVLNVVLY